MKINSPELSAIEFTILIPSFEQSDPRLPEQLIINQKTKNYFTISTV